MKFIRDFLKLEAVTGIFLAVAAILAILAKNGPLHNYYDSLVNFKLNLRISYMALSPSLTFVVNDFLMSFFFLMIGLELKREFLEGHLQRLKEIMLPAIAALGGLIFPALIYVSFTYANPDALQGWAIPAATDIAFAMGVLALLSTRIPKGLKICLLSLAIFDDIAAIVIIAVFYTHSFSFVWFLSSLIPILGLFFINLTGVKKILAYFALGLPLWLCILKSGVHPTVAGIFLGFFIPLKTHTNKISPLKILEKKLHPWVSFFILPVFAFFNAGVTITDLSIRSFTNPIVIGIGLGLFFGKQFGVMLFSYLAIKLNICSLPMNTRLIQFYGMAIVTGIGFTMSLFIGDLSFAQTPYQGHMRFGVIMGSLLSGIIGYCVLWLSSPKKAERK